MTSFSESGSSRHGEAEIVDDVIDSKIGDSGMNEHTAESEFGRRAAHIRFFASQKFTWRFR